MVDGSLFVDIIPNFSELKKRARNEEIEVGVNGQQGTSSSPSSGGAELLGVNKGMLKTLGIIGVAISAVKELLEVFKPIFELLGAIMRTLGLLLVPLLQLLFVLLIPILKWLSNFIVDFLDDPFGALVRGITSIFTQLLPDLLTGIGGVLASEFEKGISSLLNALKPSGSMGGGFNNSLISAGFGPMGSSLGFLDRILRRSGVGEENPLRRVLNFNFNAEGLTTEATAEEVRTKVDMSSNKWEDDY